MKKRKLMKIMLSPIAVVIFLIIVCSCAPSRDVPANRGVELSKYPDNFTSFKIRTQTGYTVITDPYAMNEDAEPDLVTVSHTHSDHCNLSRVKGKYGVLCNPGSFMEGGYAIEVIPGHHNKGDGKTTNLIFVFDFDGLRIAQFCAQGAFPSQDMLDRIKQADVLIVQIFGANQPKLSYEEVYRIANELGARIIIPAHGDYGMTPKLAALYGHARVERIRSGRITLRKEEILAQKKTRIVVLDN